MLINHLMVTKDNNKKIKIKQDLIKESESFLILDENGTVYDKEKANLINLGYDIKIINFIDKNNTNHYNPLIYFNENSNFEPICYWLTNIKTFDISLFGFYDFIYFLKEFIKNNKNKTMENFKKELKDYIFLIKKDCNLFNITKNKLQKSLQDLFDKTTDYIMNNDDLDLNNIINKKTAIFIIYDENKKNYKTLTSLLIYQLYEILLKNLKKQKI